MPKVAKYIYDTIVSASSEYDSGIENIQKSTYGIIERKYDTDNFPPDYYASGALLEETEIRYEEIDSKVGNTILELYGFKDEEWYSKRRTTFNYTVEPPLAILESTSTTIYSKFLIVPNLNYPFVVDLCSTVQKRISEIITGSEYYNFSIPKTTDVMRPRTRKKWIYLTNQSFSLSLLYQAIIWRVINDFSFEEIVEDYSLMRMNVKSAIKGANTIPHLIEDWKDVYPIANAVAPVFSGINALFCGFFSVLPPDAVLKIQRGITVNEKFSQVYYLLMGVWEYLLTYIPKPFVKEIPVLQRNTYYYPIGNVAMKRIEELKFSPSGAQIESVSEKIEKQSVIKIYPLLRQKLEPEKSDEKSIRIQLPTANWQDIKSASFNIVRFSASQRGILPKPPCSIEELEAIVANITYPKFNFSFNSKTGQYSLNVQIQTTVPNYDTGMD